MVQYYVRRHEAVQFVSGLYNFAKKAFVETGLANNPPKTSKSSPMHQRSTGNVNKCMFQWGYFYPAVNLTKPKK